MTEFEKSILKKRLEVLKRKDITPKRRAAMLRALTEILNGFRAGQKEAK